MTMLEYTVKHYIICKRQSVSYIWKWICSHRHQLSISYGRTKFYGTIGDHQQDVCDFTLACFRTKLMSYVAVYPGRKALAGTVATSTGPRDLCLVPPDNFCCGTVEFSPKGLFFFFQFKSLLFRSLTVILMSTDSLSVSKFNRNWIAG